MSGGDLCSLLWQERFGSFHRSAAVGVLGGGGEGSKPGDEHLVNWFASLVLSLVSLGSKHLGPLSGWSSSSAWTVRAPSCFLISSKDSKGNRPVVQLRYTSWLQAYLLSRSKDFLVKLWGRITVARLRWAGSISTPSPPLLLVLRSPNASGTHLFYLGPRCSCCREERSKNKYSFCGQRTYIEKEICYRTWQNLIVCGVASY